MKRRDLLFTFSALIVFASCGQIGKLVEQTDGPVTQINGRTFLQPIDKEISLALAPTTYILIDFLDSTYCNIEYRGYRNLKTSRKYYLKDGVITITNPVNDKTKSYKFYLEKSVGYLMDENNKKLYKVLQADTLNGYMVSGNDLRLSAFLYPNLDEKEQQNGVEDRYVNDGGILRSVPHPLKSKVRKINIYDLF